MELSDSSDKKPSHKIKMRWPEERETNKHQMNAECSHCTVCVSMCSWKFDMATVSNGRFFRCKHFFFAPPWLSLLFVTILKSEKKHPLPSSLRPNEYLYLQQAVVLCPNAANATKQGTMDRHVKKSNILITQIVDEDRFIRRCFSARFSAKSRT